MGAKNYISNIVANFKGLVSNSSYNTEAQIQAQDGILKAYIPNFLYKPPYGYPRYLDIATVRKLALSPYVFMVTSTIIDEVTSIKWDIVPKATDEPDEEIESEEEIVKDMVNNGPDPLTLSHIKKVKDFFYNPNGNDESFEFILRQVIRDILELDSGIIIKVFNRAGVMTQIFSRDGGTFLKNPDVYGYMGNKADIIFPPIFQTPDEKKVYFDSVLNHEAAYFQYGWTAGGMPVPFGKREIIWMMRNPRSDSIYGRSPIEVLKDMILSLIYGAAYNLDMYTNSNMPEGAISLMGAEEDTIDAWRDNFQNVFVKKDDYGNNRKQFHKYPVGNSEVKFTPFQLSSKELEIIQQQQWFTKLVWASFGVTPSELGFTENSNRATELGQNKVFQRKAIKPILSLLEYHINSQIMPEFGFDDVEFKFQAFDVAEETEKAKLYDTLIKSGIFSINEAREELGLEKIPDGDDHKTAGSDPFGKSNFNEDEENDIRDKNDMGQKAMDTSQPLTLKKKERLGHKIKGRLKKVEDDILNIINKTFVNSKLGAIKSNVEVKALNEDIINKIKDMFSSTTTKSDVESFVRINFMKGMSKSEKEFNMNFFPDKNKIDFIANYNFDLIQDATEDLKQKLRSTLSRAYMNNSNFTQIKEEVKSIFKATDVRVDAIVRTETTRIENIGHIEGARQSNLNLKKEVRIVNDARTTELCERLHRKYKDNPIGLDEKFKDNVTGEEWETPPFHVNCRSDIKTVQVEEE